MNSEQFLLAAAIVFASYFIRGIAGFGSGLIAVPLLAMFQPLIFVVPLILLLDFSASLVMGGVDFKQVQWKEIRWLIPFSLIGVLTGTRLLVDLPARPMLMGLSLFVLVFAIRIILNTRSETRISQWWAAPAGFSGGAIGSLFGTGGPPYIIYLTHRVHNKGLLRGTFSALFVIDGLLRMISFMVSGLLLSRLVWWNALFILPIMLGGLYMGSHVHTGLSHANINRIIGTLLLISSLSLLLKGLFVPA